MRHEDVHKLCPSALSNVTGLPKGWRLSGSGGYPTLSVPGEKSDSAAAFFPRVFCDFLKDRAFRDFPAFFELFCCTTRTQSALGSVSNVSSSGGFVLKYDERKHQRLVTD